MGFFSFIFISSFTFFYFVIYFFVVFHCFYDDDDDDYDGNDDDDDDNDDDDDEQASKNCHENVSFLMSCPSLSPFNNVFAKNRNFFFFILELLLNCWTEKQLVVTE